MKKVKPRVFGSGILHKCQDMHSVIQVLEASPGLSVWVYVQLSKTNSDQCKGGRKLSDS